MTKLHSSFVRQFGKAELQRSFRRRVVWMLVEKELLAEEFAVKLLACTTPVVRAHQASLEVKQESDVVNLAQKMIDLLAVPFEANGHVHSIVASIGIAIYPADGDTPDILFKHADTAMYRAKGTEKRVVVFRDLCVSGIAGAAPG